MKRKDKKKPFDVVANNFLAPKTVLESRSDSGPHQDAADKCGDTSNSQGCEAKSDEQRKTNTISSDAHGLRVLIPINSQDSALYALESAMARKWHPETKFMLLTVIEGLSGGSLEAKITHRDVLLAEQKDHRLVMNTWLNRLKDSFMQVFPHTEAQIECGRISEKICEVAASWEADYIMIGSHDFNLVDRTAIGSIASKVLMSAPCTVEAVRFHKLKRLSQTSSGKDTDEIRLLANQSPKRIIVATDFSQQAATAIKWVADSTWLTHTEIRLVHVTEATKREPGVSFLAGCKGYISEQQYQRTLEDRLRSIGREIADKQPCCKLDVFVLQSDSVSGAILELASMWDADLVVVGAEGADSTDEAKAGSTALPIMDSLECSAIAIRDNNRRQVHFSWYPELQKQETIETRAIAKVEAKK